MSNPAESALAPVRIRTVLSVTAIGLVLGALLLLALDLLVHHQRELPTGVRRMLNLAREGSVGTWYSSMLALLNGVVLMGLCLALSGRRSTARWAWGLLALLFVYVSMDDAAKVHERLGSSLHVWVPVLFGEGLMSDLAGRFPSYPWQLLFAPIFGSMALLLIYVAVFRVPDRLAAALVLSGLGCLVLAVGLDFLEGLPKYGDMGLANDWTPTTRHGRHYQKVLEEMLEITAMSLCLLGFMRHGMVTFRDWRLGFH